MVVRTVVEQLRIEHKSDKNNGSVTDEPNEYANLYKGEGRRENS